MDTIWETDFRDLECCYYMSRENVNGEKYYSYNSCKYVYKITCTENNKSYIGRTKDPVTRIREHYIALRNGKHKQKGFQEDFDKYGENSFSFEIIGEDNFGLNIEKKMQKIFKTYLPEYGYNTRDQNWYSNKKSLDEQMTNYLSNAEHCGIAVGDLLREEKSERK